MSMAFSELNRLNIFALMLCALAMIFAPGALAEEEADGPAKEPVDKECSEMEDGPEKDACYEELENPIKNTKSSLARGRSLYRRLCTGCHGPDGKALIDVIADATDLTTPEYYLSGSTEGQIFRSIKEGAGVNMPPYKLQIKENADMWHMVNYVQSLWPEDIRPEVEEEEEEETGSGDESDSDE